jgi:hypothetical protein
VTTVPESPTAAQILAGLTQGNVFAASAPPAETATKGVLHTVAFSGLPPGGHFNAFCATQSLVLSYPAGFKTLGFYQHPYVSTAADQSTVFVSVETTLGVSVTCQVGRKVFLA